MTEADETSVDIAWLLDAAQRLPGDPGVTDYGALVAAVARMDATLSRGRDSEPPHTLLLPPAPTRAGSVRLS